MKNGSTIYALLDDRKLVAGAKQYFKKDEKLFREWNARMWGVYFSVNEFDGARKSENCTKLRYVYGDLDIAKSGDGQTRKERQDKKQVLLEALLKKCEPSLVIDTSNGLQPLWKISDSEPTDENKLRYTRIIKGIVEWSKEFGCKADNVYDCSRILRLAGYNHCKEEPYLCDFIHKSDKVYSFDELEKLFPIEEKPEYIPKVQEGSNPVFNAIEKLDFREMIIRAFGSIGRPVSFDKSGHLIDPIGKTTGTFIGRRGNRDYLASSSHEPYKGNRITAIADILKIDYGDAYKWICKEYNLDFKELSRAELQKEKIKKLEVIPVKKDYKLRYTWGTRGLDTSLAIIKRGNFIIVASKSGTGKTTFVFDMACKNARLGHKVLFLSLEMDENDIKDDFGRKYSGITIGEEYDYLIPEHKQKAYKRKIDELDTVPNLKIVGLRRTGEVQWEDIEDLIKNNGETDIVFIDNLDLISAKSRESDLDRQKRITKSILNFTSQTTIPVVLIHHYRKTMSGAKDMGLDEMGGSGKIRDGADRIIKVAKTSDLEAIYPTVVYLQKGRGYPETMRDVYFIKGTFVDEPPTLSEYESGQTEIKEITEMFNSL
jgi:KaiC/GvpD/RAD55 family RecA-like ATPase